MKNKIVTIIVIAVILLIAGGIIFFKNFQGSQIKDIPSEEVAKWIGSHSVLYIQTGCHACENQEKLFGENYQFITAVDCFKQENRQKCIDEGIEATPTWIINGKKYVGVQSVEKLKELTDYQD